MGYRVLTVDGREFDYILGREFLKIKTDSGSHVVPIHQFLGLTPDVYREMLADRCDCCYGRSAAPELAVTPAKIADYIRRERL